MDQEYIRALLQYLNQMQLNRTIQATKTSTSEPSPNILKVEKDSQNMSNIETDNKVYTKALDYKAEVIGNAETNYNPDAEVAGIMTNLKSTDIDTIEDFETPKTYGKDFIGV
tara:strand:+ start:1120 stop:1455 length:336 start_codon:yes stop_codon:yes gene_type:complete